MTYTERCQIAYNFHKRHSPPSLEEWYWEKTIDDMMAINNRYKDNYLKKLLILAYDELSRSAKTK